MVFRTFGIIHNEFPRFYLKLLFITCHCCSFISVPKYKMLIVHCLLNRVSGTLCDIFYCFCSALDVCCDREQLCFMYDLFLERETNAIYNLDCLLLNKKWRKIDIKINNSTSKMLQYNV